MEILHKLDHSIGLRNSVQPIMWNCCFFCYGIVMITLFMHVLLDEENFLVFMVKIAIRCLCNVYGRTL